MNKQTALNWFIFNISYTTSEGSVISYHKDITRLIDVAQEMERNERLKHQLFIGKVTEILGFDKTLELLKECNEVFKSE